MDGSFLGLKSVSETVASPPCTPSLCIGRLLVENECNGNGNDVDIKPREIVGASLVCGGNVVKLEDEFTPVGEHANNLEGQSHGTVAGSEQGDLIDAEEIQLCQATCHSLSLHEKDQKGLQKCASLPCSALLLQSASEKPAYKRSVSLPTTSKLVSAMKGSRAKNGTCPTVELRVKWAPEVYDPPITSVSHTVNRQQERLRAKKRENHKQKNKGKSSRGGVTERKHRRSSNGSTSAALDARSRNAGHGISFDARVRVNTEALEEYAMSRQESKCGSRRFMREAVAKMHFPTAEAS